MNKMDEIVLALPREELFKGVEPFNGFKSAFLNTKLLHNIITYSKPMRRGDIENDPSIKHLIPYVVLNTDDKIFVTRRTENQTESRLHGKHSIGVGGHIGPYPDAPTDTAISIHLGMLRELTEELTLEIGSALLNPNYVIQLVGFVNVDYDEVGQVHFGLVYSMHVEKDAIKNILVRETENMVGEWLPIQEAKAIKSYETWSSCILEAQ